MKLKYEEKIAAFQPCPSKTMPIEAELIAYRFSQNPIESAENFLPVAVKDLSRITGRTRGYCCSAYGLSMFTAIEKLEAKYQALREFNPFIHESLGSFWVSVKIDPLSGSITPPDKFGHFNLHEAAEFNGPNAITGAGVIT
ncbi:hypothetical protein JVX96_00295 [Variovorax sp. PDNC026]|uniref:hypothetical protein n=1 Tax=Variovorax sp. PDNC026 TaxID=2811425 RepID=UPI0019668643|nr:hypothetical protein [Variovorax sp. PDNC026]QRY31809.1 hypothetical protein JVX96_00295 [Variovorax sp. PDNC026]